MPHLAVTVFHCVSAVVGLILNGYIVLVLVLTRQIRTAHNALLLHLGFADLMLCLVYFLLSVPLQTQFAGSTLEVDLGVGVGAANDSDPDAVAGSPGRAVIWALANASSLATVDGRPASNSSPTVGVEEPSQFLCNLDGYLGAVLHAVVIWTICGLNCEKYCAIVQPLRYNAYLNNKKVLAFVVAAWTVGFGISLPPLLGVAPYRYHEHSGSCVSRATGEDVHWYVAAYTVLAVLVPSTVVLLCNMKIYYIARHHRHCIASAIYEVTLSAHATITHQGNPFYLTRMRARKAVYSLFHVIGSLFIIYWPHYSVLVWESFSGRMMVGVCAHLAVALISLASPVNGFVYGVKSRNLRKTLLKILRRKMYQSEVNQEIKARESQANNSGVASRRASNVGVSIVSAAMGFDRRTRCWLLRRQSSVDESCRSRNSSFRSPGGRLQSSSDASDAAKRRRYQRQLAFSTRSRSCSVLDTDGTRHMTRVVRIPGTPEGGSPETPKASREGIPSVVLDPVPRSPKLGKLTSHDETDEHGIWMLEAETQKTEVEYIAGPSNVVDASDEDFPDEEIVERGRDQARKRGRCSPLKEIVHLSLDCTPDFSITIEEEDHVEDVEDPMLKRMSSGHLSPPQDFNPLRRKSRSEELPMMQRTCMATERPIARRTPPPVSKQVSSPALQIRRPTCTRPPSIRESWSFMKDKINNSYSAMRKTRAFSVGSRANAGPSCAVNGKTSTKSHSVSEPEHPKKFHKYKSVDSGLWVPLWTQGAQSYGVFHGYQMECIKRTDLGEPNN